jgi:membrane protein YdbS with pleckstrin-like domain
VRNEPAERIDIRALTVWRLTGCISTLIVWSLVAVAGVVTWHLDLSRHLTVLVLAILVAVALLYAAVRIVIVPAIRWRRWRYQVNEREIDLQRGVLFIRRTLIPMSRVQHVDTVQGPLLRRYKLASVHVSTAAGTQEIPALAVDVAEALRDRIAALAGVAEDV